MRWGDYPGLSRWALNAITRVLNVTSKKEAEGNLIQTEDTHRRKGSVNMEAEIGVMQPQAMEY